MANKIQLYFHTIKYLKMSQIIARLEKKIIRKHCKQQDSYVKMEQIQLFIPELDENSAYIERYDISGLLETKIKLLHEERKLDLSTWKVDSDVTHLWFFNLHYMEYLIPLALQFKKTKNQIYYDKIKEYFVSWMKLFPQGMGDAWEAYTISLRIPNLIIVMNLLGEALQADSEFYSMVSKSIYNQYSYLKHHTERHLLGNHYFENLKALVVGAVIFDENENLNVYLKQLDEQLDEQVLEDGMHFERSFMYHKICMEDLMRIIVALRQKTAYEQTIERYSKILGKMTDCLASFEKSMNRTLLFNDAGDNVAKPTLALLDAAKVIIENHKINEGMTELKDAGYYQYVHEKLRCVIDCGIIGPDYIPGHGQCDCLSFEFFWSGIPVFVNSGTYQYQTERRAHFRSTQAHNTFLIDGVQQSQCWGEHRVAKRVKRIHGHLSDDKFKGSCVFWNGSEAEREMIFDDGKIAITDKCKNHAAAKIQSYVHLHPDWNVTMIRENKYRIWNDISHIVFYIETEDSCKIHLITDESNGFYAEDFGKLERSPVFEVVNETGNETNYRITWEE